MNAFWDRRRVGMLFRTNHICKYYHQSGSEGASSIHLCVWIFDLDNIHMRMLQQNVNEKQKQKTIVSDAKRNIKTEENIITFFSCVRPKKYKYVNM